MTEELEKAMVQTDLEQRLAAIRAERAAIAERGQKRDANRELLDQVEAEERALKDEQAIEAAIEAHGPLGKKIAAVHTSLGVVIVKRPNHVLFKRFQDSGEATSDEFYKLVLPTLVHPARTVFDSLLEEQPGVLSRIASEVCLLAGVQLKAAAGK